MAMDFGTIKAVIILDSEGKRIASKYYGIESSTTGQFAFEKKLYQKTNRTNARIEAEIVMYDGLLAVYKFHSDVYFYIVGGQHENELILVTALNALVESTSTLLRNQVDRTTLIENIDLVLLVVDELVDSGMIMETDPDCIVNRVAMRGAEGELPITEQTFSQALASAKEQIVRSFR